MAEYIEQICKECAEKRGWVPVTWAVGIWPGLCEICNKLKSLTAPRDFRNPDGTWVNSEMTSSEWDTLKQIIEADKEGREE
jgi:hypothetical protein